MLGIIPFLIQWLALSQFSNRNFQTNYQSYPLKSHWTLLSELQQFPEEELENFLPQLCNILLDRETISDDALFEFFERILVDKCEKSLLFGAKVSCYLKASVQAPSDGIFKSMLSGTSATTQREERLRYLQQRVERATSLGNHDSNSYSYSQAASSSDGSSSDNDREKYIPDLSSIRSSYYQDVTYMVDSLTRLGTELKKSPVPQRNHHLKEAIAQCNLLLYNRMISQESITSLLQSTSPFQRLYTNITPKQIAELCPAAACFSLHLPLQHTTDKVCRLLRFVETECEVLPSKERCPYLVVVELLEQDFDGKSELLYSQGHVLMQRKYLEGSKSQKNINRLTNGGNSAHDAHLLGSPKVDDDPFRSFVGFPDNDHTTEDGGDSGNSAESVANSYDGRGAVSDLFQYLDDDVIQDDDRHGSRGSCSTSSEEVSQIGDHDERTIDHIPVNGKTGEGTIHGNNLKQNSWSAGGVRAVGDSENVKLFAREQIGPSPHGNRADLGGGPQDPSLYGKSTSTLRGGSYSDIPDPQNGFYGGEDSQNYNFNSGHLGSNLDFPPSITNPYASFGSFIESNEYHSGINSPYAGMNEFHESHNFPGIDGPVIVRGKTWEERKTIVKNSSPFGHLDGWNMKSFIVKSGDDIKKEIVAMQLIEYCQKVFKMEGLDIYLRPYQLYATGFNSGLVEFIEGAQSIDSIKKSLNSMNRVGSPSYGANGYGGNGFNLNSHSSSSSIPQANLKDHFEMTFGPSYSFIHARAVENFVKSLVGYSLITYLLQVKDRHNANIMIGSEGHIIHIDYGFILGDSPGFNINFESAPFKFTREYAEIMGGFDSTAFAAFEELFTKGFLALQKHIDGLTAIIQLFYKGNKKSGAVADSMRSRLMFPQSYGDITSLIRESFDNWRTKQYDWYQQRANNIQM